MKIFSVFFVLMTFVAGGAMADANENNYCWQSTVNMTDSQLSDAGLSFTENNDGDMFIKPDYIVYFENDSSSLKSNCSQGDNYDKLWNTLTGLNSKGDIATILLFGGADATANHPNDNPILGQQRVKTVLDKLPRELQGCVVGQPCAHWSVGDATPVALENYDSIPALRGVYMFVIYKRDICDKTGENIKLLQDIFTTYSNKIDTDGSIKKELENVARICGKNSNDKIITLSQRKKILDAENKALKALNSADLTIKQKIAKEHPDLAVKLIAQSIENIRLSLADNASVWKNENGNFNGWRVVSDSIAGIVLGTAGGVITSNVVKKNQLKKGFENIMCTIGGQKVADYGDEFVVGIQR